MLLRGVITAPPSKSYSHRAVLAASLAKGKSIIRNVSDCDDVKWTIKACRALGARVKKTGTTLEINGFGKNPKSPRNVYFGGSGTTLRLMLPLFSLCKKLVILNGDRSLQKRPNKELLRAMKELGIKTASRNGKLPITVFPSSVSGKRTHITVKSSQFISSLLFFSALGNFEILARDISSRPYIDMTADIMEISGITVKRKGNKFTTRGNFKKINYAVPGDWSLASLFISAACFIPSQITIRGLKNDRQGDREILRIMKKMGAKIDVGKDLKIYGNQNLRGLSLYMRDFPDIVPAVAMAAAFADGKTTISGIAGLRDKESNRVTGIIGVLKAFGARTAFRDGKIVVGGNRNFTPKKTALGKREHKNDHRLAMMAALLGMLSNSKILDIGCVNKSYPTFQRDLRCLKSVQ
ncbi:MAG: 3-phosphoshikimate 1-carboxyvinyltransferase [Candidatus Aenigmarchaeota archaeon]|nr:3-phosphoshikimate 1-carboxyvinyltransferase [Candidatus Aenigmarchaeota archaeon]